MQRGNVIILRPAKRILFLYSAAFLVALMIIVLALGQLQNQIGLQGNFIGIIWKASILIGGGLFLYGFLWRLTSVFTISEECVASTIGILSKNHIRIPLNRIVDYQVITPFFERILGLGSIHIDTAGTDELIMQQISKEEIGIAVVMLDGLLNKEQHRSDNPASLAAIELKAV